MSSDEFIPSQSMFAEVNIKCEPMDDEEDDDQPYDLSIKKQAPEYEKEDAEEMISQEMHNFLQVTLEEKEPINNEPQFVISEDKTRDEEVMYETKQQGNRQKEYKIDVVTDSNGNFICGICNKILRTKMSLYNHHKFIHNRDNLIHFVCKICGSSFPSVTRFKEHFTNVHSENDFKCLICNYHTKAKKYLDKHYARTHFKSKIHECQICNKRFANLQELGRHKEIHLESRPIHTCEFCNKEYLSPCALKNHKLNYHSNEKHELECKLCGKVFKQKLNYNQHLKRVHFGKLYSCDHCSFETRSKFNLGNHILQIHLRRKKKTRKIKKVIITEKEEEEEKPTTLLKLEVFETFNCNICNKVLKTRNILAKHKRNVHSQLEHCCSLCPKKFRSKDSLSTHFSRVHENHKQFNCHLCVKTCKSKGDLKKHLVVHSDERPFQCTQCPAAFKYKSILKKHSALHSKNVEKMNAGGDS